MDKQVAAVDEWVAALSERVVEQQANAQDELKQQAHALDQLDAVDEMDQQAP